MEKRKNRVFLTLFGFIFVILVFLQGASTSNQIQGENIIIRVGAYDNAPKIYPDGNGGWTGFFPEILKAIAEDEGWIIQWVEGTWDECLERLEDGSIDMMVDVAFTEERALLFDYNQVSLFTNWGTLYSTLDENIHSLFELEGKTVGTMEGSVHTVGENGILNVTDKFNIDCNFTYYQSYTEIFEAIDNNEVDVGVVNRLFGLLNEKDYSVRKTAVYINPVELKFAFPKNSQLSTQLIERIDFNLIEMKDNPDSVYYYALDAFFLRSIDALNRIPSWVFPIIYSGLGLVIVFIFTSFYLKRSVDRKTKEVKMYSAQNELLNEILLDSIEDPVIVFNEKGKIILMNKSFIDIFEEEYGTILLLKENIFNYKYNKLIKNLHNFITNIKDNLGIVDSYNFNTATFINSNNTELEQTRLISLKCGKDFVYTYYSIYLSGEKEDVHFFFLHNVTEFIELDKLRRQFISTVSHELRTPITSINLTLSNLIKYRDKLDDEKINYMFEMMKKSGDVLSQMIEDLLITSRIESGTLKLEFDYFEPAKLIDDILYQMESKIEYKNLKIKMNFDRNINLFGSLKRIEQVFRILIDNAIKYSPDNEFIIFETEEHHSGEYQVGNYDGALFKIKDHGVGIPEEDLSKLFDRFFRASNVGKIQGTGLGLVIAKDIVRLHRGDIFVKSREDEGTIFYVFIPYRVEKENSEEKE